MSLCNVESCDKEVTARGFCCSHYNRLLRYGSPTGSPPQKEKRSVMCLGDGCDKIAIARGLCKVHYDHLIRKGSCDLGKFYSPKGEIKRWLTEVAKSSNTDDCILFPFRCKSTNGYGHFSENKVKISAHTFVCTLSKGEKEEDSMIVCHSCGNGHLGCVNPRHLRWDYCSENWSDSVEHGTAIYGQKQKTAALTNSQAIEIYERANNGERGADLAREYGMTRAKVSMIKTGKIWSLVTRGKNNGL